MEGTRRGGSNACVAFWHRAIIFLIKHVSRAHTLHPHTAGNQLALSLTCSGHKFFGDKGLLSLDSFWPCFLSTSLHTTLRPDFWTDAPPRLMAFTIWSLYKSGLLFTNGVAVLHRKRFLRKCECGRCMHEGPLRNH